jgi:ankyrin repeat protein
MAPPHLCGRNKVQPDHQKDANRVHKQRKRSVTKSNQQGVRGRPSEYSIGWIKKLLLLRLCGLTNHEVVEVLGAEGNAVNAAKYAKSTDTRFNKKLINCSERTIQDYVKRFIGEPEARYGGPSKLAAREQASILRRLLKASAEETARRSQPTRTIRPSVDRKSVSSANALGMPKDADTELVIHDNRTTVGNPNRLSMACSQFSLNVRLSVTSSLLRAIDRFSRSTWSSASTRSILGVDSAISDSAGSDLYSERAAFLAHAKAALDQKCCGRYYRDATNPEGTESPLCLHLRILLLMRADVDVAHLHWEDIKAFVSTRVHRQSLEIEARVKTPMDAYGNNELFFATRVGAPLRVILLLIDRSLNVGMVNAEGQNFLFFLNPVSFDGALCTRVVIPAHSNPLECLIHRLEHTIDFEHLDHHGRWFLHYLLALPGFQKAWLLEISRRDPLWQARLRSINDITDSAGYFLPTMEGLVARMEDGNNEDFLLRYQSRFRSGYVVSGAQIMDRFGRSQLQQYIRTSYLRAGPSDRWPIDDFNTALFINNYSSDGRTPIMEFLVEAIGLDLPSSVICPKLGRLIRWGANVNARSRGGHTVLHLAAGHARPQVVEFLLQAGVQIDHRDNAGRTAYDYAWDLFSRSRKRRVSPLQAARSFQSLVVFGGDRKKNSTRTDIHGRSGSVCQLLEAQNNHQTKLFGPLSE